MKVLPFGSRYALCRVGHNCADDPVCRKLVLEWGVPVLQCLMWTVRSAGWIRLPFIPWPPDKGGMEPLSTHTRQTGIGTRTPCLASTECTCALSPERSDTSLHRRAPSWESPLGALMVAGEAC